MFARVILPDVDTRHATALLPLSFVFVDVDFGTDNTFKNFFVNARTVTYSEFFKVNLLRTGLNFDFAVRDLRKSLSQKFHLVNGNIFNAERFGIVFGFGVQVEKTYHAAICIRREFRDEFGEFFKMPIDGMFRAQKNRIAK